MEARRRCRRAERGSFGANASFQRATDLPAKEPPREEQSALVIIMYFTSVKSGRQARSYIHYQVVTERAKHCHGVRHDVVSSLAPAETKGWRGPERNEQE